jgi:hypothetical protein
MAIQLKNLLLDAEEGSFTINHPDGTTSTKPFKQRSFTYGDSTLTNPPLIVKDFDGNPLPGVEDSTTNPTLELVGEVTDNFVRGGAVTLAQRAVTDVERLGKVLISPNGLAWSAAQLALTATNPQNLTSPRNRLTLPVNTLLTAGTGVAGVRFRKDGLLDIKFESGFNYDPSRGGAKYEIKAIEEEKFLNPSDHTLKGLYNRFILSSPVREDLIKSYNGGAHSLFGIGQTEIKRYKSNPFNDIGDNGGYLPQFNLGLYELRQGKTPKIEHNDYRNFGGEIDGNPIAPPIPNEKTRINLYKLGNPGSKRTEPNPNIYDIRTGDKISAASIFKRSSPDESFEGIFKDYIKFRIAVVNTENPLEDNVILFRAMLNSINDNFSANWNSYKYNGRAEEFYTYSGFNRGIDFSFKIHAQSKAEQKPLWRKLNYLVAQTAPEYKNRRMRGVFSRLTIGDWMNEIPGFFTSIGLGWNTSYPWEIRHDSEGVDKDINEYPHILDVNCTFQPIHNFAPTNSATTPFILPEIGVAGNRKYAEQSDDENQDEFNVNGVAADAEIADINILSVPEPPAPPPALDPTPASPLSSGVTPIEERGLII